jgi:hypothetical protein
MYYLHFCIAILTCFINKSEMLVYTVKWAQHKAMTYGVGNPSPGYGQAQQCSGI